MTLDTYTPTVALEAAKLGLKWCGDCEDYKPFSEFGKNRSRPDGLSTYCIPHQRLREKQSRDKKKPGSVTPAFSAKRVRREEGLIKRKVKHICNTERFGYCIPCRLAEMRRAKQRKVRDV